MVEEKGYSEGFVRSVSSRFDLVGTGAISFGDGDGVDEAGGWAGMSPGERSIHLQRKFDQLDTAVRLTAYSPAIKMAAAINLHRKHSVTAASVGGRRTASVEFDYASVEAKQAVHAWTALTR